MSLSPAARPSRRALVTLALGAPLAACTSPAAEPSAEGAPAEETTPPPIDLTAALEDLEARHAVRIGLSAVDMDTGRRIEHRAQDRFGYASSFKVLVAEQMLRSTTPEQREELIAITRADVEEAGHAPVAEQHIGGELSLSRLAEAAIRDSDNAATNLVLARIGGPEGLDAALEELGDDVTEVVHDEPELNDVAPGSTDDTTTAATFTAHLQGLFDPERLAPEDLAILLGWMSGNAVTDPLIRAGAPEGWEVADKSGGAGGIRNDIGLATRPDGSCVALSILTRKTDPEAEYEDAVIADVAALVLAELA